MRVDNLNKSDNTDNKQSNNEPKDILSIILIDGSGSMTGSKHNAAIEGTNGILSELQDNEICHVVQFSRDINTELEYKDKYNNINQLKRDLNKYMGMTALYKSFNKVYNKYIKINQYNKNLRILVNIFTDGLDNVSTDKERREMNDTIERLTSLGHTVSFLGTHEDRESIMNKLSIDESNLMTYDNTSKGVSDAFSATKSARAMYSLAVSRGEDTSLGFYKKLLNK